MTWKKWPSWLKGGAIGIFIYAVLVAVYFFMIIVLHADPDVELLPFFVILYALPYVLLFEVLKIEDPTLGFFISHMILSPLCYFLIGAIIGLIIRKCKSKNKKK